MPHVWIESDTSSLGNSMGPSQYEVSFSDPIYDVKRIALRQYSVPLSPYYMVVRVSKWFVSGQTSADYDDFSSAGIAIRDTIRDSTNPAKPLQRIAPATIYTEEGTASLVVHKAYSTTSAGQSDDFRVYTVFLCTGSVSGATSDDTWMLLNNLSDTTETPLAFTDETSASYGSTPNVPGNVTTAIYTLPQRLFLKVRVNGQVLDRIKMAPKTNIAPYWESFHWYRPGEIVLNPSNKSDQHMVHQEHMSLVLASDVTDKRIRSLQVGVASPPAQRVVQVVHPADGSFMALQTGSSETVRTEDAGPHKYEIVFDTPIAVQNIELYWVDGSNNEPLFPAETAHVMASFDASDAVADRIDPHLKFKDQSFLFELETA